MKLFALAAAALTLATPTASGVSFLQTRQLDDGSFAERGGPSSPQLTAWAALGMRAAGASAGSKALRYLQSHEAQLSSATDIALVALAEQALGANASGLLARLHARERRSGSVGLLVNGTAWAVLAYRAAGMPVRAKTVRWLVSRQNAAGGWGWNPGAADSNDTAAVVEALCATGQRGRPVRRALRFLLAYYGNRDGGFSLTPGRGSDAQSTAWVVQAFLAARKPPPRGAIAYLKRLRRSDGSFRYSTRYVTTPVWVTSQVLPALARKPFPLKR